MNIITTSFDIMAERIRATSNNVVIFGAGMIGRITIVEILHSYGLDNKVTYYVDNDKSVQNTFVNTQYASYPICSVEKLYSCDTETIILLCVSRYTNVLEQLKNMTCTESMTCYIIPMMCIYEYEQGDAKSLELISASAQIPKVIHYIWLGKNPLPPELEYCISTWKTYCPTYEIIRWDESNYDISKNAYMKQAYEQGAFSFAADYARIDIVCTYGGICLDTDVELIKPFDDLLAQSGFCGVEKWQTVNLGGCCGAVKGNQMLQELKEYRENISFINEQGRQNRTTCGVYDTEVFLKNGYMINGKTQRVKDMTVYSNDYFHPYDYMSGRKVITVNTHSIHHFNGGWLNEEMKLANEKAAREFELLYKASMEA